MSSDRGAAGSRGPRLRSFELYAGGFLGPFGGAMLIPLIPSVADGLGTSVGLVALSVTTYTVPFAAFQLVSGTIAERLGGGRVVRAGYVVYGGAALLCTFAPEIWTFLGARALAGTANAFLTPILLAALYEAVPRPMLGRSVGTFAAVQTAGLTLAPLIGGALGELSWRLAFTAVAAASLLLALAPLELRRRTADEQARASLRALVSRRLGLLSAAAAAGYAGFTGIGFLVALVASEEFGLGAGATGLLVATYGVGGILLGRLGVTASDRLGKQAVQLVMAPGEARDRLTRYIYISRDERDPTGLLEVAFEKVIAADEAEKKLERAIRAGKVRRFHGLDWISDAARQGILTEAEAGSLREAEALRERVITVDSFDPAELKPHYVSIGQNARAEDNRAAAE